MAHQEYKCMVIGGGRPDLYDPSFFQVGSHPSAHYGIGQDWLKPDFWTNLDSIKITFPCIIFDQGSESWMPPMNNNNLDLYQMYIVPTLMNKLNPDGVIIMEHVDLGYGKSFNPMSSLLDSIMTRIGLFRIKGSDIIYGIYGITSAIQLQNNKNIYNVPVEQIGIKQPAFYIKYNPAYLPVAEMSVQEFVLNRIQ